MEIKSALASRVAITRPPTQPTREYAPTEEHWQVGSETFQSTEDLLKSNQDFQDRTATYSFVTRQKQVENPVAVRLGRAAMSGAGTAAMLGSAGALVGGFADVTNVLGDLAGRFVFAAPNGAGPASGLALTLGLVGAGA